MSRAFLDVERSATGRRWEGPEAGEARLAEALAQATGLPMPLCVTLARRGVTPADVAGHMAPMLRDLLPDPRSLRDMDRAAARVLAALQARERIAVFADYDVDGAASAALILVWLRAMGHDATLYIPDRIEEGYGPNVPAMAALGAAHDLIVCVDCGTLSHAPVAAAGCDVVILDHHLGGEDLPPAVAVVNPNRRDEDGTLAHLCAASVVFLMLVEANRLLRAEGVEGPDLMALLDLVALATVADVARLTGVNRAFVRQGLRVMAGRGRAGLRALCDVAGLARAPDAHALGFLLGPRINAGGRIGRADLGARLLSTADPQEAGLLAAELDRLNAERRAVEAAVREAALAQAEARGMDGPLVWAAGEGWHPGVVGIVAARLKEASGRPAIVIGLEGGVGRGSARSVAGIDLGSAVQRVAGEGLLLQGGGHAMAAGLTVAEDRIEAAMARLGALLAQQGAGIGEPRALRIGGLLMPSAATHALMAQVEAAGPYGAGAPAPRFAFANQSVTGRRMGESHLRLSFGDGMGRRVEGVAFGAFDGPLGDLLSASGPQRFHLAGRLEIDRYGGREAVRLRLEDAARA